MSGEQDDGKLHVSSSVRYIPEKGLNGRWTNSLQLHWKRLSAGVDYRPLSRKLGPLASLRVLDESKWLPAAMIGTGPDQFGKVHSQAYFAVASKKVAEAGGIALSPMAGAGYIEEMDAWKAIAGATVRWKDASVMFYHNGFDPHLIASLDFLDHHSLSFVYWGLKMPGVAYSVTF